MDHELSPDASRSEGTNEKPHKPKKEKKKKEKSADPDHKTKKEKHKKHRERDQFQDEGPDDGGGESAAAVKHEQDRRYSLIIQGSGDVDGGPGLHYMAYVVMDDLADKLKLLDYERDFCKPLKMKPLNRHYFVYSFNVGEQFYLFTSLAAWLVRKAGRQMEQPQEYDDPNVTISTILDNCRQMGLHVDFPPSKLKQGSGEQVIYIIDRLADQALKTVNFQWQKPEMPDGEEIVEKEEDEAEITTEKMDEDVEDAFSEEEDEGAVLNLEDLKNLSIQGLNIQMDAQKPDDILESTTNTEEWRLEMERVLPQLRVQIRSDTRDWRNHLDQMHQYRGAIDDSLSETQSLLNKLHGDVRGTLDKIVNREKYLNSQLEHLLADYRTMVDERDSTQEQYKTVNVGVVERSRQLAQLTDELDSVKQELEERGTSMTDGTPLVNIRKALNRIKQEVQGMDVRIGVVEHTLLQFRLRDKEALQQEANVQFTTNSIGLY
ncbi:intraflagellar transport protein 57 homolog [Pollicipes pollicipes]|uniref:intraflagellar transport protein 57 homolog n=1 Tax=Pollicipes pollicipes TaxID=41117 RepID=UPI001885A2B7|nr:intraflagellar transport protein 57 homolog [Pollicipes pollicipes]XP_037086352.1 intraflagellar transport protein 57 homolog [Pollicipes pollicipes]